MRFVLTLLVFLAATGASAQVPYVQLMLDGQTTSGTTTHDQGWIRFLPDAEMGWDRHDGSKYMPPASTYTLFALMGERAGNPHYLSVSSLPDYSLPRKVNVRMDFNATDAGTYTYSWDNANLPRGWKALLIDMQTGARVKMWRQSSYTFDTDATAGWSRRFVLRFRPAASAQRLAPTAPAPEAIALATGSPEAAISVAAPAPNPTRGAARLTVTLAESTEVGATIYDAIGREVASVAPRSLASGTHTLALPADGLSPGAYIVRVTSARGVHTQRLTVVR